MRVSKAAVHLVHVIANPADAVYEPEEVPNWDMVDHAEKKARQMVETFARQRVKVDVSPQIHVVHGDPFEKLMEIAKEIHPDLIVMSTRGRGSVAHLVVGSVTEKMVRHAPCPVFVAHRLQE